MFSLQGGPAILSAADQLGNNGLGQTENILDIDPYTDKDCARLNTGSYCKATTTDGVELFKSVQLAINAAAGVLESSGAIELFTPLKIDGVIGPGTADLASQVLMAAPTTARTKVWIADPRSTQTELMAPLLAAQPQYAVETFEEIAAAGVTTPVTPQPATPAPTTPVPTPSVPVPVPVPVPVLPATTAPKVFWTRKKKVVALAGAGVLAVGLLALVLWMRKHHD